MVLAKAFSWSIDTYGCMLANSGGVITCAHVGYEPAISPLPVRYSIVRACLLESGEASLGMAAWP